MAGMQISLIETKKSGYKIQCNLKQKKFEWRWLFFIFSKIFHFNLISLLLPSEKIQHGKS